MLSERVLTKIIHRMTKNHLAMVPAPESRIPEAKPGQRYMLYMHVPFCQRLCPFCSFNRYRFDEKVARPYFESMRKEMLMLKDLGYDFHDLYIGGGTPTIMLDELCETIDLARDTFHIEDVGTEMNPNHLAQPYLDKLRGRVQRLSVGVQSFDDGLLKQMDRYKKYGSGDEILARIAEAIPYFDSLNVDMIFNFPSQTEEILISDLEKIATCGCRQTTFSPLYVSSATTRKMAETLGSMDYDRERRYYHLIDGVLAGGEDPLFKRTTLWTFTRNGADAAAVEAVPDRASSAVDAAACTEVRAGAGDATEAAGTTKPMSAARLDEFQVSCEQYPAIGSGSISCLDGCIYVNTFSIEEYSEAIAAGRMPLMGKSRMGARDLMRYRFLLQLYQLRLDKRQFKRDFGISIERGLPAEMAFMRLNGAFATDNEEELTLTSKGRYLTVVMYRQFLSGMNNLRDQARDALSGPEHELLFGDGTQR